METRKRNQTETESLMEVGGAGVEGPQYVLYRERWVQLLLLSGLALISDWVCFATAAVPREFYEATGHRSSSLINAFLMSNVVSCFLYTDLSRRFGLRRSTAAAGLAMAVGCLLRSGPPLVGGLPPTFFIILGTTLVGMAQPFFQCAPPRLSATWFSRRERSLATATALNANQLGIAAAFVVGGKLCAGESSNLKRYLDVITATAFVVAAATWMLFKDRPPTPPTASAAASRDASHEAKDQATSVSISGGSPSALPSNHFTFHKSLHHLMFRTKGFLGPLAAFVTSIAVTNVVSAFAGDYLERSGAQDVDLASVGASFQVAIVVGGIILGAIVDATHTYKATTMVCLLVAIGLLLVLAVACGYDSNLPAGVVVFCILGLGAAVGPVQPINAELAVEVSYPFDENSVEAAQQLAGNFVSAILVPLYQAASIFDLQVFPDAAMEDDTTSSEDGGSTGWASLGGTGGAADSSGAFDLGAKESSSAILSPGAIKKQIYSFQEHNAQQGDELVHPFIQGLPLPDIIASRPHDARGDSLLLVLIVLVTLIFFASYKFELKRLKVDEAGT